ncbi:MAG: dTMP kinase [Spirochaetia bacterium]|nr:dTMP kinase [Spirochaetia bacterium]
MRLAFLNKILKPSFIVNYRFIVLEGIDGSGKSTLAENIKKHFSKNHFCIKLSEPTELNLWGRELRKILKSKASLNEKLSLKLRRLFKKDRLWDIKNRIKPALQENKIVILDRYYFSTAAYQGENQKEADEIMREYTEDNRILQPDCVLYLKIKPEYTLKRMAKRNEAEEIFEHKEALQKIFERYEYIVSNYANEAKIIVLDAGLNEKELASAALAALNEKR